MTIDLDTARAIFEGSRDLTVGLEEEFAILDSGTLDMVPRFEELRDAAQADPVLAASIAGELISSEIEIRSGPGDDLADAIRRQRDHRRRLFSLALERGMALGATGTHPWADYREQRIIDTAHYRRVEEGLQYVAWRNNTFSLHVHVGLRDAERAVAVCDRLRPALPLLLAVSANSPYVDGRDSGLHTARTQTFTKSFPRCGVPDSFGTWAQFSDYVRMLERTNSIVEYTQVWWSIRPHVTFGTVEVRICDAQGTAQESEGLAALIVAAVAQAARDHDVGRRAPEFLGGPGDAPARLIEENMWRAIRFGLDGPMLDLGRLEEYPGVDVVPRLLEWSAPARAEHGIDPVLPERTGAQRQRRRIAAGATMDDVYAASVRETRETYAQEIPA